MIQLFGSKTRVKLLHLFLSNPDRSFYVREITRKIDEQINSVRRELANLLNVGVIKSDSANNRLYYTVNQKYRYYKPLRDIFVDETFEKASASTSGGTENEWAKRLKPLGAVKFAVLGGRFVQNSKSGVDLLIAGDVNKTQVKKFVKDLEQEESAALNYTVMSYEDFYYRLSIKDLFVTSIVSDKKIILLDTEHVLTKEG
ncbi:MAG TPA: transcriptional regulator [Candidatus Saccharimonadales bacterium]|nr:transcriptional regulator [Candidatus Saccharimonadales bacterium]